MGIYLIPEAAFAELNVLAVNGVVDIASAAVTNSPWYRAIQTATELQVHVYQNLNRLPETLLLIARIVAKSPTIHTVNMVHNNLGAHGPATATALAASPTIHTVNMRRNNLGEHGPATATALAASPTIHTVNMSDNDLGAHGPATATALAASPTIHTVDMRVIDLGAHGPSTATALTTSYDAAIAAVFTDYNQYVADLIELTHLICIEGHSMCDELLDLICSYLDVPIDFTVRALDR